MYNFKGSKFLFAFVLVTMMIPTQLGLVAFVVEMKAIGWMNTLLPLIVPPAATGFGVYWMKNFIGSNFPKELMDSARIFYCSALYQTGDRVSGIDEFRDQLEFFPGSAYCPEQIGDIYGTDRHH